MRHVLCAGQTFAVLHVGFAVHVFPSPENPALQVQAEAERTFLTYAARFGLTLSDRQSIKIEVGRGDQNQGAGRLLS